MPETAQHRLKRLQMRSMRRGIKEMDLILSGYAAAHLDSMAEAGLLLYDQMLNENDHDLYQWVTGQSDPPDHYGVMIAEIRTFLAA